MMVLQEIQLEQLAVILFRLGVCYERTGRWGDARGPYRRIVEQLPVSSVGPAARRRLQVDADHFAVQCGVFSDYKNADALVAQLERDGFKAEIRRKPRHDVLMHVVLIGHYRSFEEAVRELARIKGYVPGAVLWP